MPVLDAPAFAGPLAVTMAYIGVYYAFQIYLLAVKRRLERAYAARGEKFDRYFGHDREMLAADRYQLNMLEHMGPFLALMWLVAVFVGPSPAAGWGAAYVATRVAYPFALGRRVGRGIRAATLLATFPSYVVLVAYVVLLIRAMG